METERLLKEQKSLSLGDRLYRGRLVRWSRAICRSPTVAIERGKGWRYELPDPSRELFFRWSKGHSDRSDTCYLLVQAGLQARRQWRCFQFGYALSEARRRWRGLPMVPAFSGGRRQ